MQLLTSGGINRSFCDNHLSLSSCCEKGNEMENMFVSVSLASEKLRIWKTLLAACLLKLFSPIQI